MTYSTKIRTVLYQVGRYVLIVFHSFKRLLGINMWVSIHMCHYYTVAKEIHELMLKLGEELSPHEVEVMLNLVDVDGDGQISFDEFYRYIMKDPNGVFLESGSNSPITSQVKKN